jgi:rusticyanin
MSRRLRIFTSFAVFTLIAAGLGVGIAFSTVNQSSALASPSAPTGVVPYSYYQSMMGQYSGTSMMGGSFGSIVGHSGYGWMMGGLNAPGWMRGGTLPHYMMGSTTDPGKFMGSQWANAPGPRVTSTTATRLGNQVPSGAIVDRTHKRITFGSNSVRMVALASPTGGPDETFRIAGMVNPTVVVKKGAQVSVELINADASAAHGFVVTTSAASAAWMPMAAAQPVFSDSAVWFLGDPTTTGMHESVLNFTANKLGKFHYLCAIPSHAQKGMTGNFNVTN